MYDDTPTADKRIGDSESQATDRTDTTDGEQPATDADAVDGYIRGDWLILQARTDEWLAALPNGLIDVEAHR